MADAPDADQKTEAPTAKRRHEAVERGETLQSRELSTALAVGGGVIWVLAGASTLAAACRALLRDGLTLTNPLAIDPIVHAKTLIHGLAAPMLAFAAIVIAGAIAGPLLTAPHFSAKAFTLKPSRIDPVAGLKRLFGGKAFVELGRALLKAGLIFGAGAGVIKVELPVLLALGASDSAMAAARVGRAITALLVALGVALVAIAGVDLPVQLVRHLAKLRMSKHEIKEENRESEGSPETKAAQRRVARQAAKRALVPAMAEASVVVVNPAHFAVALRYVPHQDAAPIVVAKGRDLMAEAIRDLAADKAVAVLRYPELTRAIYFTAPVGAPIRDELFSAVAAVLAFVFSLDAAAREQPDVELPDALHFDEQGGRI